MGLAAVIFAIVTVLFGTVALGEVATPSATSSVRVLVGGHLLLAASGLVLLLVAVVAVSQGVAWASFAVLIGAAALGVSTLVGAGRSHPAALAAQEEDQPAKPAVPVVVVVVHGAAAALTIVLVLLAAIGVGKR